MLYAFYNINSASKKEAAKRHQRGSKETPERQQKDTREVEERQQYTREATMRHQRGSREAARHQRGSEIFCVRSTEVEQIWGSLWGIFWT